MSGDGWCECRGGVRATLAGIALLTFAVEAVGFSIADLRKAR